MNALSGCWPIKPAMTFGADPGMESEVKSATFSLCLSTPLAQRAAPLSTCLFDFCQRVKKCDEFSPNHYYKSSGS